MEASDPFEFIADGAIMTCDVLIDRRTRSKTDLLVALAHGFNFPDYFGHNWDALIDCLSDLSWLTSDEAVLFNSQLPDLEEEELRLYLTSIEFAKESRADRDHPRLRLVFCERDRSTIEGLLRPRSSSE